MKNPKDIINLSNIFECVNKNVIFIYPRMNWQRVIEKRKKEVVRKYRTRLHGYIYVFSAFDMSNSAMRMYMAVFALYLSNTHCLSLISCVILLLTRLINILSNSLVIWLITLIERWYPHSKASSFLGGAGDRGVRTLGLHSVCPAFDPR